MHQIHSISTAIYTLPCEDSYPKEVDKHIYLMGVSVPFLVYQLTDYCFKSDYNHLCVFACCCIYIGYPVGYSTPRDQVSNESHLKGENYGNEAFSIKYTVPL